jgi:putative nucleotidyltransferase with HDIG domain
MMSTTGMSVTATLPASLDAVFRQKTDHIQMLPATAVKALELVRNPDCSITEFTSVVERDVKLATDLLAMANSAIFSFGRPISSLHQSVVRQISLHEEWIRELLRHHSFLTAMLAINVNRAVGAGFQGEEFAAGLLHDVGRTLFAVCLPESFSSIDSMDFDESIKTLEKESCQIGTDHCELGAWFAQNQNLPTELIDVIRFHHDPGQSVRHRRLVALISTCDHMANHLQRTGNIDGYDIRDNSAVFVLEGCGVRNAAGRLADTAVEILRLADRETDELMI